MATQEEIQVSEQPPRALLTIVTVIDTAVGQFTGQLFAWLVLPMALGLAYEVLARYLFHAPTVWAYDVTYMLYGSHFMLGAAYTLYRGQHIRTDMLYEKFSTRWKGIVDATLYLLFFFPGMLFFFLAGWDEAMHSWSIGERSDASPWRPIIYPFKTVMPVTAALLIIQGVSEFLKSAYAAIKGRELIPKEAEPVEAKVDVL
ncbi:MAG: C4-dicarboxylate ABC transporter substrate-binding protein [Candidatus Tectimicrobiota bacterium]|nr:MAG: C4-dicarboxylate ABC transporter substrate-binding protein [Candidatus Tectomicrobia bacterium]